MKPLYLFDDIALKSPSGKALGSEVQDSGEKVRASSCWPEKAVFALAMSAFTITSSLALAVERRHASATTCETVQDIVQRDGEIILRYPSRRVAGMTLFDRYVTNSSYCDDEFEAVSRVVDTADDGYCQMLACRQRSSGR
jgi:hypothetical protein